MTPIAAERFAVSGRTQFPSRLALDEHGPCRLRRAGTQGWNAACWFGIYEGTLRELIGRIRPFGKMLAAYLAEPRDQGFDVIVPIPLYWRRAVATGVLSIRSAGCRGALLRNLRSKFGSTHTRDRDKGGLSNARRRETSACALKVKKPRTESDREVLLVDDVMASSATRACRVVPTRAGTKSVAPSALARRLVEPAAQMTMGVA